MTIWLNLNVKNLSNVVKDIEKPGTSKTGFGQVKIMNEFV
jgi:hypothetical protein